MFKAQVLRRTFSVFNRVPASRIVQSAARHGHESVTIHRVRIQKPFFSRQRLVGLVAVTAATYALGQYLGLEVTMEEEQVQENRKPGRWKKQVRNEDGTLDELDDKEANQGGPEDDGDEHEDEAYGDAILFLPTGFSRQKPKIFYKGSDPEWQEFMKITRDQARMRRIQQELVNIIRTGFSRSPANVAKIGQVDVKKGKAWIEVQFPDGPEPGFERPGYELTEDLEWRKTTRDIDSVHHHKLKNVLHPRAAAGALYEDTKRKAERSWNDFAVYIGWAEKTDALTFQQTMQQITGTSPPASPASPVVPPATTAPASSFGASMPGATQQPSGQPSPPAAGTSKDLGIALPNAKALTLDLGQFRQEFHKANHKHAHRLYLPRGAFGVRALIEIFGARGRVTLNIVAIYDPKAEQYIGMHVNVWNQMAIHQTPKGGP